MWIVVCLVYEGDVQEHQMGMIVRDVDEGNGERPLVV